jgi:hypothetical protein
MASVPATRACDASRAGWQMFLLQMWIAAHAAIVAAALQALGFALMARAILRGDVHPNQFSWLIWSVVATLAAMGSWRAGATGPLAGAAMNAVGCISVLLLALRHGSFADNRGDAICLAVATVGVAGWLLTDDPAVGLVLFLGADACGAIPTIRNIVVDPARESVAGWAVLALAGGASVVSVEPQQWGWSWTRFGYWGGAVYVAMVNLVVSTSIILVRLAGAAPDRIDADGRI